MGRVVDLSGLVCHPPGLMALIGTQRMQCFSCSVCSVGPDLRGVGEVSVGSIVLMTLGAALFHIFCARSEFFAAFAPPGTKPAFTAFLSQTLSVLRHHRQY